MTEEKTLLELTSDPVFKAFMMSENTKVFKARYISLIAGIPEKDLLNAEYISRELSVNNKKDKVYKSDIIVHIEKTYLNIEMNNDYYNGLLHKNTSYLKNKCYTIGEIKKMDELEKLSFIFIKKREVELDMLRGEKGMEEAINELEMLSSDEKIVGLYDAEKVAQKVMNTRLLDAETRGLEQGIAKGIAEGMEKGEKKKSIEIAKKMLLENIDIHMISKITSMTIEEINNLKE